MPLAPGNCPEERNRNFAFMTPCHHLADARAVHGAYVRRSAKAREVLAVAAFVAVLPEHILEHDAAVLVGLKRLQIGVDERERAARARGQKAVRLVLWHVDRNEAPWRRGLGLAKATKERERQRCPGGASKKTASARVSHRASSTWRR